MPGKLDPTGRLLYGGIAAGLFIIGLVLIVLLFWLVFPAIIGLGLWLIALIFLNLAIKKRTFKDWNEEKIARRLLAKKRG